jgi:anthranilate/para-aminobenzoate synthase component II
MRNSIAASEALQIALDNEALLVLSPGPGGPRQAGCCLELIEKGDRAGPAARRLPRAPGDRSQAGGRVIRAAKPVHGKTSLLRHDGRGPFAGLDGAPLRVGRYHSLCTRKVPERFTVHGEIDGMAMAISDRHARQTGLQFHPESILTSHGDRMLANILEQAVHGA